MTEPTVDQKCKFCGANTVGSDVCYKCLDNPERQQFFVKYREAEKEFSLDEIKETLGSTIKKDDATKLNVFHDMLLTYTYDEQQNTGLIAGSSTGKSHIPLEIAAYFPKQDIIKLGYASPTSFSHQRGIWMRDPRLPPLPEGLNEDEEETKKRQAKENLVVIDLHRTIIIFLDAPHSELLKNLRALLSHDDKYIEQHITDRNQKTGMRTKRILLVGYPTVIFCSANTFLDEQEKTRLNLYSPESSQDKIREAIAHKIYKDGNREEYNKTLEEDPRRQLLQARVIDIKNCNFQHITIPEELQAQINEKFLEIHHTLQARHQRDVGKLEAKIKACALLNYPKRKHKINENVEVNYEDVINGFALYETYRESNELGLPPEAYDAYLKLKDEFLSPGITLEDYQKAYFKIYKVLLGRDKARNNLKNYTTVGLLVENPDPNDKRKTRYMCAGVGVTNSAYDESQLELLTEDRRGY